MWSMWSVVSLLRLVATHAASDRRHVVGGQAVNRGMVGSKQTAVAQRKRAQHGSSCWSAGAGLRDSEQGAAGRRERVQSAMQQGAALVQASLDRLQNAEA